MANDVVVSINIPEAKQREGNELTKRAQQTLKLAQQFNIVQPADFELAANELAGISRSMAAIDSHRKDMTRPIDRAKAEIMDKFKPALALLDEAKNTLNRHMLEWRQAQERLQREAQRKLEEAAAKERARLEEAARKLEAKGKSEQAAEKLQQAAQTVAPVVTQTVAPQVRGVAPRKTWRAECHDIRALCQAVIDNKVAPLAVEANLVFLNEQARSLEEHFNDRYPGCKAVAEEKYGRTRG